MVILGSISSWLRRQLKLPEKMTMPHIWTLAALAFVRFFRFPRFLLRPGRSDRLQANSSTHPRRCGVVLSDLRPWSPWDHPIFLKFWVSDIEIDPKSIYVHISRPHPDRPPPELVRDHQKSRKFQLFQYFSNLSRHGFSRNVTEQSTMRKISIFFW